MDAETIIINAADDYDWTPETVVSVLGRFLDSKIKGGHMSANELIEFLDQEGTSDD
jgi:hypothetical protein